MRHIWLRSVAVIGIGLAVLAIVLFVATTIDARAPQVTAYRITQPLGDDPQVALTTTSIEVAFSESVDQASAEAALVIEPAIDGAISWSGNTLVFTPAHSLPVETAFTVRVVAGVVDRAGNEMTVDAEPFSFETAGRPQVVASDPADGSDRVDLDTTILISFSTLMDTSSVEAELDVLPGLAYDLRWSGDELEIVPTSGLRPGTEYEIRIGATASDVAGVQLGGAWSVRFRTAASALAPIGLVPADGVDGVAGGSPIAALFDQPIDPESLAAEQFVITPQVPGSVGLVELPSSDGSAIHAVHFTPSTPLPPNTTFEVALAGGVRAASGVELAGEITWSFTTGAPIGGLGNQLLFLTDRSGVANLWTMNADGTGQRQVSAELVPILDFAVAPDGRSVVVADGRRLILLTAGGSDRRVLTEEGVVEFDPAWAPDGRTMVFGRADAETGEGLGLWSRSAEGGDERQLTLPQELGPSPSPEPSASAGSGLMREPTFAPDGQALAFVDASGIGILELPEARLTRSEFLPAGPPIWLPDASAVLVAGSDDGGAWPAAPVGRPIEPLDGGAALADVRVVSMARSGPGTVETGLGARAFGPAVIADGRIAYLRRLGPGDSGGGLFVAEDHETAGRSVPAADDMRAVAVAAAPEPNALVLAVDDPAGGEDGGIWLVDLDGDRATQLTTDGSRPRWLP